MSLTLRVCCGIPATPPCLAFDPIFNGFVRRFCPLNAGLTCSAVDLVDNRHLIACTPPPVRAHFDDSRFGHHQDGQGDSDAVLQASDETSCLGIWAIFRSLIHLLSIQLCFWSQIDQQARYSFHRRGASTNCPFLCHWGQWAQFQSANAHFESFLHSPTSRLPFVLHRPDVTLNFRRYSSPGFPSVTSLHDCLDITPPRLFETNCANTIIPFDPQC